MAETTSLSSTPRLEPKLSTLSSNFIKKLTELCRQLFNLTGKNLRDLVCPPEFFNVPLKFR